ncbi:MAG: hypothetical protein GY862_07620, partial [Gammaproteobacteria bacterium]|nr:hypothetical protein [Gammaproteobacteria bacterium]
LRRDDFQRTELTVRALPPGMGDNHAAYIEALLGDALPWAQCCAMLQPISLGLADALRRAFFSDLPAERIERLYRLPGNTETANGLNFSQKALAILRTGFQVRLDDPLQKAVLRFLLDELRKVKPDDEQSPAFLAWEWRLQRVNLELNPDVALQRLIQLSKTPLGAGILVELESVLIPSVNGEIASNPKLIPLWLRPKGK